jgi:hypothetical protein
MKQEVIQDFLNLPGIVGVALMDGRSRPYFCGVDQTLNFQQKEALAQGILQVVQTIPSGFEAFQFQFTGYQVHIYKLAHGMILLVLTQSDLVYADYLKTIKDLKAALQEDMTTAIASFRSAAGNLSLRRKGCYDPDEPLPSIAKPTTPSVSASTRAAAVAPTAAVANPVPVAPVVPAPPVVPPAPVPPPILPVASPPSVAPSTIAAPVASIDCSVPHPRMLSTPPSVDVTLKEVLGALNWLSGFAMQYFGRPVIVNYWKSTRPNYTWLHQFQVERTAQITWAEPSLPPSNDNGTHNSTKPLSLQEQQWLQAWIAAFLERCSQVVREFPALVEHENFAASHKKILLGDPSQAANSGNAEA